jgi:Rrf2 family protein
MKLSSKSRYGLNAMYHLALVDDYVSLTELSKQTNVSQPYLEKVLGQLKKKKLIDTLRGVQGGYKLTKNPKEITIGEVLRALENDLVFSDCARAGKCNNLSCPNKGVFKVIYDRLNSVLDELTLQDMIDNKGELL